MEVRPKWVNLFLISTIRFRAEACQFDDFVGIYVGRWILRVDLKVRARSIEFSTVSRSSGFAAKSEVIPIGTLKYRFLETGQ